MGEEVPVGVKRLAFPQEGDGPDQEGPKGSSSGSAIPGTIPNKVSHWGQRKTAPLSPGAAGTAVTLAPHEGQSTVVGGIRLTLLSDGSAMTPSEWSWEPAGCSTVGSESTPSFRASVGLTAPDVSGRSGQSRASSTP
jgi:hypothetical protein